MKPTPWLLAACALLAALCACAPPPESYSPPIQRPSYTAGQGREAGAFVEMSDPNAPTYFVQDINDYVEGGAWRWTRERPELRFWLESVRNLTFQCDFGIAEATFTETGPVTFSASINGHPLGEMKCPKPALYSLKRPVPAKWLRPGDWNNVALRVDKIFTTRTDQIKLGFVLYRAGFLEP